MHIKPTTNETTDEIQQLIPPLTHQYRNYINDELNPSDEDIPRTSKQDSGYLLLFITLLFAKDVTLNNSHPSSYPYKANFDCTADILHHMHTTEKAAPTFGPLTRQWVNNIITHNADLTASLPTQLKALYDSITKIPMPSSTSSSSSSCSKMSTGEQMSIG